MTEQELKRALSSIQPAEGLKERIQQQIQTKPTPRTNQLVQKRILAMVACCLLVVGIGGVAWFGGQMGLMGFSAKDMAPAAPPETETGTAIPEAAPADSPEEAPANDPTPKDAPMEGVRLEATIETVEAETLTVRLEDGSVTTFSLSESWRQALQEEPLASGTSVTIWYDSDRMELLNLTRN